MTGPVTDAIRAMQAAHDPFRPDVERMLRPEPLEPHPDAALLARRAELLAAHAEYADARAVENRACRGSPEERAAVRVAQRLWRLIEKTLELTPLTLDGLAVIGLALVLHAEGIVCGQERDGDDYKQAWVARAILSVTGASLPPDFIGWGDEPDFRERERRALHDRPGRIPDWALQEGGTP